MSKKLCHQIFFIFLAPQGRKNSGFLKKQKGEMFIISPAGPKKIGIFSKKGGMLSICPAGPKKFVEY
tara:strand:+ start:122 stop:322 length:201 start_codon:yes stop_codon:yes gene_type:complete